MGKDSIITTLASAGVYFLLTCTSSSGIIENMTKGFRFPITKDTARQKKYRDIMEQIEGDARLSYFIKEEDADFVKIGQVESKWNLAMRMSTLQVATPHQLVLVGVCDKNEKDLHKQFDHLRVRGEWFKYSTEIKSFLSENFSMPVWMKSMKCPFCKTIATFYQEEICIYRWGTAFPICIDENGELYANHDDKRKSDYPSKSEPFDKSKCLCDNCHSLVSLCDIELVEVI